jgi:glutathione synthase/RimK-type ligase-like ATP-grasp enzyme
MSGPRTAIIIAPETDVHARAVAHEIETQLGGRAVILDATDYPERWQLTVSVDGGAVAWEVAVRDRDAAPVRSRDFAGLWWRRIYPHAIGPEVADERARRFCENEARAALLGWVYGLGAAAINPLSAERAAAQKTLQLTTAARLGLAVPRSLVTNSPDAVRKFFDALQGRVVFKVQASPPDRVLETRELRPEHFDGLSSLAHAPAIFQECVHGTDLRVTIVDDDVFAIAIRPNHPGASLDWRLDTAPRYEPYDLPARARRDLLRLMRELGLRYGACDLRVTPAGDYVFLEVNTGGQYLFVEIQTRLPISRSLAEALLRGAPADRSTRRY